MCEHCGCLAIRSIDELTCEHGAALEQIRTGRAAAASGDLHTATSKAI